MEIIENGLLDWTKPSSGGGGEGGTTDHRELTNRNSANQHSISSITNLQTTLDSKTINIQLYFDGTHIYRENGGAQLNYTQIYNIISEETNNVSVNYSNSNVLYPAFWTGDAIEFTNILMIDDKTYSTRLIINAQNQINYEEEDLSSGQDISNLANKDLSNLTATGKSTASGLGMPSNNIIDLSIASGGTYTCPANGWLYCGGNPSQAGQRILIYNPTTHFGSSVWSIDLDKAIRVVLPCKKDDVYTIIYTLPVNQYFDLKFIYAEGEI